MKVRASLYIFVFCFILLTSIILATRRDYSTLFLTFLAFLEYGPKGSLEIFLPLVVFDERYVRLRHPFGRKYHEIEYNDITLCKYTGSSLLARLTLIYHGGSYTIPLFAFGRRGRKKILVKFVEKGLLSDGILTRNVI